MTCAEIVDDIETEIRYAFQAARQEIPGTEEIVRIVNKWNDRISQQLKIPRRYVKSIDATAPFALPAEARPGSLSFSEESDGRVEVLTVAEANQFYPDWEKNEHEGHGKYPYKLVVYDPHNISAPVYPIGFSSGDTLRIAYVIAVSPMVVENSAGATDVVLEPFNGLMPEFHHVVGQMAKYELLLRLGDQRATMYYADAQVEIEKAFAYARNDYHLPMVPNLGLY